MWDDDFDRDAANDRALEAYDRWLGEGDCRGECPGCGLPMRDRGEWCSVCRPSDGDLEALGAWSAEWTEAATDAARRALAFAAMASGDTGAAERMVALLYGGARWEEPESMSARYARGEEG